MLRRQFLSGLALAPLAAGALGSGLAAGWPAARAQDSPIFFRIGTGSTAGTYFPVGGLIASAISHPPGSRPCDSGGSCGVPGLIAVVQSTEGSVYNVQAVAKGQLESALSQADVAYWAYHGEGPFAEQPPLSNLRAIANLYPESVQLVASVASGVRSVADLADKRVSIDLDGSGTQIDAKLILKAWGLTPEDLDVRTVSANEAVEQLREGELDAFFYVAGTPTTAIEALARDTSIRLVPIDGEPAERLLEDYPFFARGFIAAGLYRSVPSTVTLSVGAQWICSAEIDEALIYEVTTALWHENTRRLLDAGHQKGRLIAYGTALNSLGIPLHRGALRYYRERRVIVPDVLEPPTP
ncbi:MAG: TAXI family TRAP transporter solute-binding subunit [Tistlia sp.]|uniref:TAXI family TRAP transporter solute-binding subunit n=1 Tax=Tistlia sp. TaxID=3057121 RepID=UPI0034A11671